MQEVWLPSCPTTCNTAQGSNPHFLRLLPGRQILYQMSYWASKVAQGYRIHLSPARDLGSRVQSQGWEDSLEKEMANYFSILAWNIPWTEGPGGLQPMGCKRVEQGLTSKQ